VPQGNALGRYATRRERMTDFKIPAKARQEIKESATFADGPVPIEYPEGSGVWATYEPEEREIMRNLTKPEMDLVHEAKSLFDATLYNE
jgi:hypothetical protein